jgi:hypothetical protein
MTKVLDDTDRALLALLRDNARTPATDLARKLRVQLGAVALELDQVPGRGKVGAVARRMPGGSGSQFIALDEYRIRDAKLGQVVQRTAPNRSTADDDHSCVTLHAARLSRKN